MFQYEESVLNECLDESRRLLMTLATVCCCPVIACLLPLCFDEEAVELGHKVVKAARTNGAGRQNP